MTLLEETIEDIKRNGHKISDIIFIGSEKSGHSCTWEEFTILANQDYDSGYDAAKVAIDLLIIFSDGSSMYREEYDGSEWWEYIIPFIMPRNTQSIKSLFTKYVGWQDLAEINK